MTKIEPFIGRYWEEINYLPEKYGWKKKFRNNLTIALNVVYAKNEKIYHADLSKHNSKSEK